MRSAYQWDSPQKVVRNFKTCWKILERLKPPRKTEKQPNDGQSERPFLSRCIKRGNLKDFTKGACLGGKRKGSNGNQKTVFGNPVTGRHYSRRKFQME